VRPPTAVALFDATVVPLDRRARRRHATHDAIRRAALQLVAKHGLDQVSIEMITERADVGYRTFFNHFANKEDALVDPGGPRASRVAAALDARPAQEDPLEALRAALLAEFDEFDDQRTELCAKMAVIENNPSLLPRFHAEFAAMERAITEAIARRTGLDPDLDLYPHLLAAVAGTALRTCLTQWRAVGSTGSPKPLVKTAFNLLAAGLTPPPAHRRRRA
jgi:AcrR family transcriptional regulator